MSNMDTNNQAVSINTIQESVSSIVEKGYKVCSSDFLAQLKHHGVTVGVPKQIIIIGCGGTGSWFMPKLVKIINDAYYKKIIINKLEIIFIDGDEVEQKNLLRQNFVPVDIGKNKAEVMANRYGCQIHDDLVTVKYIDKYITVDKYKSKMNQEFADRFITIENIANIGIETLIFNFIDNGISRKMLHSLAMNRGCDIIDVGNNEFNGQLTFSHYSAIGENISTFNSWYYIQHTDQLDDMSNLSIYNCANVDEEAIGQMFNANDMAASVAGNFFNCLIMTKKVLYARYDFVTNHNLSVSRSAPMLTKKFWDQFNETETYDIGRNVSSVVMNAIDDSINKHFEPKPKPIKKVKEVKTLDVAELCDPIAINNGDLGSGPVMPSVNLAMVAAYD